MPYTPELEELIKKVEATRPERVERKKRGEEVPFLDLDDEVTELTDLVNELVAVASGDLDAQPSERIVLADLAADVAERGGRGRVREITVTAAELDEKVNEKLAEALPALVVDESFMLRVANGSDLAGTAPVDTVNQFRVCRVDYLCAGSEVLNSRLSVALTEAVGAVAAAAGAHAHADPRPVGRELGQAGLADGVELGEVGDPHRRPRFRSSSTSRMRACSVTWPRMAWSTSTTGASAHCPKQATVRTVNWRSGVVRETLSASMPASRD